MSRTTNDWAYPIAGVLIGLVLAFCCKACTEHRATLSCPSPTSRAGVPAASRPAPTAPARPIISTGPLWPMPTEAQMRRRREAVNAFFAALRAQESCVGAGPYGITEDYMRKALKGTTLPWKWPEAALDKDRAEYIVYSYLMRYAYLAWVMGDWTVCTRQHNGAPPADAQAATLPLWRELSEIMENDDEQEPMRPAVP